MATSAEQLFPKGRDSKAALAGLLFMAGCWDLSHQAAQDIESQDGSYWHAIVHRVEPDSSNAKYWFRQVGEHPIFTALHAEAAGALAASDTGWRLKGKWDASRFVDWCDEARTEPGSAKRRLAEQIQGVEIDLLFSWCAAQAK
jgi:hypothetical protein